MLIFLIGVHCQIKFLKLLAKLTGFRDRLKKAGVLGEISKKKAGVLGEISKK